MALLFDLPVELGVLILDQWIGTSRDLSSLDIACTSHGLRPIFLQIFRLMPSCDFVDDYKLSQRSVFQQLCWKQSRELHLSQVHLEACWLPCLFDYPLWDLSCVQTLSLSKSAQHPLTLTPSELYDVFLRFPNLRRLDLSAWHQLDDATLALILALPQLALDHVILQTYMADYDYLYTDISVTALLSRLRPTLRALAMCCRSLSDEALGALSRCSKIDSLDLCTFVDTVSPEAFHSCLSMLPRLMQLTLTDHLVPGETYLSNIASALPRLRSLEVRGPLVLQELPSLLRECPDLRRVVGREVIYQRLAQQPASLDLHGTYPLTQRFWLEFGVALQRIWPLNLNMIWPLEENEAVDSWLDELLPGLHALTLQNMRMTSAVRLLQHLAFTEGVDPLPNYRLQKLRITAQIPSGRTLALEESFLHRMAQVCQSLKEIRLVQMVGWPNIESNVEQVYELPKVGIQLEVEQEQSRVEG